MKTVAVPVVNNMEDGYTLFNLKYDLLMIQII
ncbi:MAG: hypothetical protein K0R00_354 [Herbinix sp.]|jgi:hypothetical protein|nr:hypothetical protein [Herbinix sp.]